ncbi:uncharacterized protein EAF02_008274 [Botrytis sinoallii]|uniref:uncharacterized protein n=1 Tax=Botrytis sinoallii TaxID=1463999 RepID=UPI0019021955|nr:uncharacterized protein EAF02_008274 [Botrytis sinoallii]KAF7877054.1 hypothetical protein EAF02_008274 [Botrytis sinoallii]
MLSNYKPYEILPDKCEPKKSRIEKTPRSKCSRHPSIATSSDISNLKSLIPPPNRPHTYSQPARMTHPPKNLHSHTQGRILLPTSHSSQHSSQHLLRFLALLNPLHPDRLYPTIRHFRAEIHMQLQRKSCERKDENEAQMVYRSPTIRLKQASGALVESLFCYPRAASPSLLC